MHHQVSTISIYGQIYLDAAFLAALNDVLHIWERIFRRRDGYHFYQKDFLELLGVVGERVVYQKGYLASNGKIPQYFWPFLKDLAIEAAKYCEVRSESG